MNTYQTVHGYLALHAMMLHLWNLEESYGDVTHTNKESGIIQSQIKKVKQAVRDIFDIDPDSILQDNDWGMANIPVPAGYDQYIDNVFISDLDL